MNSKNPLSEDPDVNGNHPPPDSLGKTLEGKPLMSTGTVLIIDDDQVLLRTLKTLLQRNHFSVEAATEASAGLEIAERLSREISHVMLDLNLGEHSGLQVLPTLRRLLPQSRILILTGYASIPTTVQAIKLGADDYLTKPVDLAVVLKALQEHAPKTEPLPLEPAFAPLSVDRLEWEHIQRVLQEHSGNVSAAARALNMHRRTLQRKLAKKPKGA